MSMRTGVLCRFQHLRPRYTIKQHQLHHWLATFLSQRDRVDVSVLQKKLARFGFSSAEIEERCSVIPDFLEIGGRAGVLYSDDEFAPVPTWSQRAQIWRAEAESAFAALYEDDSAPPHDLFHVTNTGYSSPGPAQVLATNREWGRCTRITNLYHMECYAAIAAVRIARDVLAARTHGQTAEDRVDIVHTEFCTLHIDPRFDSPEHFVASALFGDGMIRYTVLPAERACAEHGLEVRGTREELIPDSSDVMAVDVDDVCHRVRLGKSVPRRLAEAVGGFTDRLLAEHGYDRRELQNGLVAAIHPGGPRILDAVASALELEPTQYRASTEILRRRGNMSSATLPHIWERIIRDDEVPTGTPVLSLTFGPGLTVAGSIAFKRRPQ